MGRVAGVYRHPRCFLIHASATTDSGVGISIKPVFRLDPAASLDELGKALRQALNHYTEPVPHPDDWTGVGRKFLRVAGFRSWLKLEDEALHCEVYEQDGQVSFTPYRREHNGKGYTPLSPIKASSLGVSKESKDNVDN